MPFDAGTHNKELAYAWLKERANRVRSKVTVFDVLLHFGVKLKHPGTREQICCPFHGDNSPSAKVYPAEGSSFSGLYCWVCRERWDVFGVWSKFSGVEKFSQSLAQIEKTFGLEQVDRPSFDYVAPELPEEVQEFLRILDVSEKRLRQAKPHLTYTGFVTLGSLLDQVHAEYSAFGYNVALKARTQRILDKIGEKIRNAAKTDFEDGRVFRP